MGEKVARGNAAEQRSSGAGGERGLNDEGLFVGGDLLFLLRAVTSYIGKSLSLGNYA